MEYDTKVTQKTTENLYIPEGVSVLARPKHSMPVKLPKSKDKRHASLIGFESISGHEDSNFALKNKNTGLSSVSNAKSRGMFTFKDAVRENARTPASTGRKNLNFNQESLEIGQNGGGTTRHTNKKNYDNQNTEIAINNID